MAPVLLVRSFVLDHACWPRSSDATPYLGSYSVLTPAGQFRPWWHSVDLKGQLPRLPHQLANAPAFRNDLTSIKSMLQRVLIIPPSARSGRTTMHAAMLLHVHGWRPAGPAIGRYPAQAARQQPHGRNAATTLEEGLRLYYARFLANRGRLRETVIEAASSA
jgi:hypothetical protein